MRVFYLYTDVMYFIDFLSNFKRPNLFTAALTNNLDELREALAAGQQLDDCLRHDGSTPLHVAAIMGHYEFLEEALKHPSADPWIYDYGNRRACEFALGHGHFKINKLLGEAMYPGGRMPLPPPGRDDP